ncbi:hypothetical protein I4F81_012645 [Pyropia yezoensis]|uniref:Uncharacterized protein n=1 Tax=Pyropia yezoensis TaxID=2788 RepID=A0ACC3CJZ2_PYRYE|nr:hypothetical protein I4F81_012645 [Neopyropia yezoensis]
MVLPQWSAGLAASALPRRQRDCPARLTASVQYPSRVSAGSRAPPPPSQTCREPRAGCPRPGLVPPPRWAGLGGRDLGGRCPDRNSRRLSPAAGLRRLQPTAGGCVCSFSPPVGLVRSLALHLPGAGRATRASVAPGYPQRGRCSWPPAGRTLPQPPAHTGTYLHGGREQASMPCGGPRCCPAVHLPADPSPRAPEPTGTSGGVKKRTRARLFVRTKPTVLAPPRRCLLQLEGLSMEPSRGPPSSGSPPNHADPRLSLGFLLNQDGATDNGSAPPAPEDVQARRPPAHPLLPEALVPVTGADHAAGRGEATQQGVPPHPPLPPPPHRGPPIPPASLAPLPVLPPPSQTRPPSLLPPTRATPPVATAPPATLVPAPTQGPFAPPFTPAAGTAAAATRGHPAHGVVWNVVTAQYDLPPTTETPPAHPVPAPSRGNGQRVGQVHPPVWPYPPPSPGDADRGRPPPTADGMAGVVETARAATLAAEAAAAAAATAGAPPWRTQYAHAMDVFQAEMGTPGPPFPMGPRVQRPPSPAYPYERPAYGSAAWRPPPPQHPGRGLMPPTPDNGRGHAPLPVSRGADAVGTAAAPGGSPMEGVTWRGAAGWVGGDTGGAVDGSGSGGGGGSGSGSGGGGGGGLGAVFRGAGPSVGVRSGRGGGNGGGSGRGGRRRRRSTGSRPRVRCTRDGCTSTFAQRADCQKHERTVHDKSRPFACDQCDRTFGEVGNRCVCGVSGDEEGGDGGGRGGAEGRSGDGPPATRLCPGCRPLSAVGNGRVWFGGGRRLRVGQRRRSRVTPRPRV